MSDGFAQFLRVFAASLITCSGATLVATLWLRDLTETAVVDVLVGGVYLILGIGLFGQSRFSLFMGVVIPTVAAATIWWTMQPLEQVYKLRLSVDAAVVLFSLMALWHVRHNESV